MARSLTERMIGAAMLDVSVYEEVEHDRTATGQAAMVVAIVALCAAFGAAGHGGRGIVGAVLSAFVSWALWSGVTYLVGTRLFGGTATWDELLRTLGFAQSPGVLALLAIVPILGWLVMFVVFFWQLATGIVAIRQALDVDTAKAVLTAIIAWLAVMAVYAVLAVFGLGLAGIGAILS